MYLSSELEQILRVTQPGMNGQFKVMPCNATGQKNPLLWNSIDNASLLPFVIKRWEKQFPGCAWAMVTTATTWVFDVDSKPGKVGGETLAELLIEHGELPETPTVRTGSGGLHFWFRSEEEISGKNGFLPDLDCKANRGYVIAPPSRIDAEYHTDAYRWLPGKAMWEIPIAVAPQWLVALIRNGKGQPAGQRGKAIAGARMSQEAREDRNPWEDWVANDFTGEGIEEGRRSIELIRRAGIHLARGEEPESVRCLAWEWSQRCIPPMDESEVHRLMEWVIRKELGQRRSR